MPTRTWEAESSYRFGFNTQERVDEISGKGNHNTALFWEYDTRLVRRWSLDPVVKHWESSFATFSNYPIIFVDPLGDTDYYNLKGKKIGTDGIANGEKKIALSKSTQKLIKKVTKQSMWIVLNETQYQDLVNAPSLLVVNQIKTSRKASNDEETNKKSGYRKGFHEEGFLVGELDGEERIFNSPKGPFADPSTKDYVGIDQTETADRAEALGFQLTTEVHVHPGGQVQKGSILHGFEQYDASTYQSTGSLSNDLDTAEKLENRGVKTHIVVSGRTPHATFYNKNSSRLGIMRINKLKKIAER